jgi:hypothetical protein
MTRVRLQKEDPIVTHVLTYILWKQMIKFDKLLILVSFTYYGHATQRIFMQYQKTFFTAIKTITAIELYVVI